MASTFIIPQVKYDVFLSFRGKDTRNNFTSHLHAALSRKNIGTFIDYQLSRGGEISASLLNAIESSKISIVILSEGYTSSRWCLEELTKILQCKKMFGQIVMPVFYHIHPSDVRSQTRNWGEAFAKHEENFQDKVLKWRDALGEVANLVGWHLDANKLESTFVEQIANDVLKGLNLMSPSKNKHLVGAHSRMEKIKSLLHLGSKNVFIVGIWGIGGMGKTTLVHAVFNEISSQFDNSHFCYVGEESKKYGLIRLQQKFLSRILEDKHGNLECSFSKDRLCRKKVFIVFDDVISAQQIEIFIANLECFGLGSRMIITTRDKQVLRNCGINDDNTYEIQGLYGDEALQLFSQHALKEKVPRADFAKLSKKLVEYTKGLPLALKVLGSSLLGKEEEYWESQLNRLGIAPHQDIQEVLKLSYDRLDVNQRSIFLDIACFFNCRKRDVVTKILEGCGHIFPKSEISVLVDKCLITTVDDQKIIMHDLLQEMGKEIIRQESINNPGKRSRLWHHNDINRILTKNLGTEAVQGIQLDLSKTKEMNLNCHSFAKMCNLRFFDFCCSSSADLELNYSDSFFYCSCNKENFNRVHTSERLKFPSTDLAYFRWHGYPWKSLPSRFHSSNLVALIMPHSKLKKLWRGIQDLDNLKHINLSYSEHLTKIPNLSLAPNLESLILQSCTSLIDICSSIQNLDKLATLNLRDCKSLSNLPSSIHSKSLHAVYVSGCSNLKTAPTFPCKVRFLDLEGTAIRLFPLIEHPSRLIELNLKNCARLESRVLTSLLCLSSLKFLSLGNCGITELPNNLGQLYSLEQLYLYGNYFASLPPSIKELSNLYYLDLGGCERLQYLPTIPMGIQINACNCISLEDLSDFALTSSNKSIRINLANCFKLDLNRIVEKVKDGLLSIQESEDIVKALGFDGAFKCRICYPGNEIPKWFGFQTIGSSTTIKLSPDWNNKNFLGFAMCVVVEFQDHFASQGFAITCICRTKNKYGDEIEERHRYLISWSNIHHNESLSIKQDHVFLGFDLAKSRQFDLWGSLVDEDIDLSDNDPPYIEFNAEDFDQSVPWSYKVKKCGIHLVYAHDYGEPLEETNRTFSYEEELIDEANNTFKSKRMKIF